MPYFDPNWDNQRLRELNVDLKSERTAKPLKEVGLKNLVKALKTSITDGLKDDEEDFSERRIFYGTNQLPKEEGKWLTFYLYQALKDPIILLLLFFSILTLTVTIGLQEDTTGGYIEGIAIFIAVILVGSVASISDFVKDLKFRNHFAKNQSGKTVAVLRNGLPKEINGEELMVGDIVILKDGGSILADGILVKVKSPVECDESALTGEPKAVKKSPEGTPYMVSGSTTPRGQDSLMLVTAVGLNSEWGVISANLHREQKPTPLQENLEKVAALVGYLGAIVAVFLFIALTINYIIDSANEGDDYDLETLTDFISFFVISITIIVVAVPEGLPLAVTIALAYSMSAMSKDSVFVKNLSSCETMGSATQICSDKTGTLTENKMKVTRVFTYGSIIDSDLVENIKQKIGDEKRLKKFISALILNCTGHPQYEEPNNTLKNCSATENALLQLGDALLGGDDPFHPEKQEEFRRNKKDDQIQFFAFDSERKRMSHRFQNGEGKSVFYVKGASEAVLKLCTKYYDKKGKAVDIDSVQREVFESSITEFASLGLRTLTIAERYDDSDTPWEGKDPEVEDECTLVAIVGIEDPLREGVPESLEQCRRAGIKVRMVTGDFELTAKKIATDAKIFTEGDIVMSGPEFRQMAAEDPDRLDELLPRLSVLARSAPTDKLTLVNILQKRHRQVVGVTGDGTNDAPALTQADVGMAMGIAGTDIAKGAADIIIEDDNFVSIVKAVKWGRNVRNNIQKFLQFQLTINLVALTVAFIGAASRNGFPLTPVQLLWVNLIQDTLAALALATDKPNDTLLDRPPPGRHERLITPIMWKNMILTAAWQLLILLVLLFAGDLVFDIDEDVELGEDASIQFTILFNTFVFFQIFNEFNARILEQGWNAWNPFSHIFRPAFNYIFFTVIAITIFLQAIFVSVGGEALTTESLNWYQWLASVGFALTVFPVGTVIRVVFIIPDWNWLKYSRSYNKGLTENPEEPDTNLPKMENEIELVEKEGLMEKEAVSTTTDSSSSDSK